MTVLPIVIKNANLEILTKILNSVAEKYDCHVECSAEENRLDFHGDRDCCRHITEETLAIFSKDEVTELPLKCPVD